MKLLLDTHISIRALQSPEKLSPSVRRQLGNTRNELYLSPVSKAFEALETAPEESPI